VRERSESCSPVCSVSVGGFVDPGVLREEDWQESPECRSPDGVGGVCSESLGIAASPGIAVVGEDRLATR